MAALGAASAARAAPNGAPEPQPSHPPERDFVGLAHGRALAGVCRKTVKNALKEAQRHGLLGIEERRLSAWRNAPNVVTITSREWGAWLRMRRRGEGVNCGRVANSDAGRRTGGTDPGFHALLTSGRPKQTASSRFCSHTVHAPAKPKPLRNHRSHHGR